VSGSNRRLFDVAVIALAGVSVVLGFVVVATFTTLGARHRAVEESVREDAVWAAYQLDREVKRLGQVIRHNQRSPSAAGQAEVKLRYDILYSRTGVLTSEHYAAKFGEDAELGSLAREARSRILQFAPAIDAPDFGGSAKLATLAAELDAMEAVTERLLNVSNLAQSRIRVRDRTESKVAYDRLALAMTALIVSLILIVIHVGIQLSHIRKSRRRFERLSIENADAARRAEAGARAKSIFLATMSHEIRTPLNGIIGMADLMREAPMGADQLSKLSVISDCSDTLLALIDDILDFSKLESGAVEFERAPFELGSVCDAVANVMGQRALEKGIELKVTHPKMLVTTDATRLRQILFNLVGNAVKFTDHGSISLNCEVDGDGRLHVTVEDTGIGTSSEARDRLFQDFSQLDITINRRFGGTGLGLAICRRLIDALGGSIGVSSREGHGTRFWFDLPVGPTSPSREEPLKIEPPTHAFAGRILVAEDNPVNLAVVRELLHRLGLQIDHAPDGKAAVEMASTQRYDLVLMDVQMPIMDGFQATRAIRETGQTLLPIIGLTANAFSSDRDACLEAGMNDFVSKPINRTKLSNALAQWLPAAQASVPFEASIYSAHSSHTTCLVDLDVRATLSREIGTEMVEELTRDFWPDASKMLSSAEEAIKCGDILRASREFHTLKGVAGTLGFVALEASAAEAEGALTAQGMADFPKLQSDLMRTVSMLAPSFDQAADIPDQRGPSSRCRGDLA